jgi:hemolysin III
MLVNQLPPDGGMLYTETNMAQLFPEPLNAITSGFFLAIALYWTFKMKGKFKSNPFLTYCLVLLYIGGIGGTVYHALRQWSVFIMMDWMPIMLLCVSAGVYFLAQSSKWYYAVLMVVGYVGLQFSIRNLLSADNVHLFVNINYALMALLVLLPVLKYLIYTQWKAGKWVGYALLSFALALTFRIADKWEWLSFGTHFLWHSFGAIATFCMFNYIYLTQNKKELTT